MNSAWAVEFTRILFLLVMALLLGFIFDTWLIAVRNRPFASSALDGSTTRSPGRWVKRTSADWLWYTAPPRR